jgi:hypothetical protein
MFSEDIFTTQALNKSYETLSQKSSRSEARFRPFCYPASSFGFDGVGAMY